MTKEWRIERVVVGDGRPDRSGVKLKRGTLYASGSRNGGHETFHRVQPSSLKLFSPNQKLTLRNRRARSNKTKLSTGMQKKKRVALLSKLKKRLGKIVVLGRPGARGPIEGIESQYMKDYGPVFANGGDGTCVPAALINSIAELKGTVIATEANQKLPKNIEVEKIGQVASVLHQLKVGLELKKVGVPEHMDWFDWLENNKEGVFIMRVFKETEVDHCIAVNCRRRIIIDSEEEYPIRLTAEMLKKCGGSGVVGLRVGEIREIVEQRKKKDGKKNNESFVEVIEID